MLVRKNLSYFAAILAPRFLASSMVATRNLMTRILASKNFAVHAKTPFSPSLVSTYTPSSFASTHARLSGSFGRPLNRAFYPYDAPKKIKPFNEKEELANMLFRDVEKTCDVSLLKAARQKLLHDIELLLRDDKVNPNQLPNSPLFSKSTLYIPNLGRDVVSLLLKYKADPNKCTEHGLENSLNYCSVDAVEILIKAGAQPLHEEHLLKQSSPEKIKMLVKFGVNPNSTDGVFGHKSGDTALHATDLQEEHQVTLAQAQALIESGANINQPNSTNGNTPLHSYCAKKVLTENDYKMVDFLLENGANPNLVNKVGKTPLELTDSRIIEDLFKNHADKCNRKINQPTDSKTINAFYGKFADEVFCIRPSR